MKPFRPARHQDASPVYPELQVTAAFSSEKVEDFSNVYRRHAGTVARWAARLGGPGLDWEDVVQEVFVTVNRRLPEFRGEGKLTTWLFRITEKTVRNARRKQRLRRFFASNLERQRPPVAVVTPAEELERRQEAAALYGTLERLPERARTVLVLFELEGLSTEQIAELTSAKVGTVRVWLHRARAQFLELHAERAERVQREGGHA